MSLVAQFLGQIRNQVRGQQGDALGSWLQVAPQSGGQYHSMALELRSQYAQKSSIDSIIEKYLSEDDDVPEGQVAPWSGFNAFIKDYLAFWRDVNYDDLLAAHELLNTLVK